MVMELSVIILAAGQGTRMHSSLPKVLHPLCGKPLIRYSVQTAKDLTGEIPVVVIGYGAEAIRQELGDEVRFVVQEQQLGTAHAVLAAESLLAGSTNKVVVIYADMPLLTHKALKMLVDSQSADHCPISMLTLNSDDSRGFGRVVRSASGDVSKIVEEAQATPEQLEIHELNAGVYCFDAAWLWQALHHVPLSPKGEYYLTDLVEIAAKEGHAIHSMSVKDSREVLGINTRIHLAEAEAVFRERINQEWMLAGVTIIDPQTTYIEPGVKIGMDTVIQPNTHLRGLTRIGSDCVIGPNTVIEDSEIGNACTILASFLESAVMEDHGEMGPFGHLRKGAHLGQGVHMGNFGEVKNSYLGPHTKMGHFSYIGDAKIDENVNIGAGTITCNFDGVHKNKTEIGKDAFIGSDTMLVAPVRIGEGAHTGAGAVVTHDVPDHEVVVGVPARPLKKKEISG
jgi:bifunctional UDP-N-acetylglucosamine pyrophosphorylase / glucosamine-1-phosphate N-acetyltransferase